MDPIFNSQNFIWLNTVVHNLYLMKIELSDAYRAVFMLPNEQSMNGKDRHGSFNTIISFPKTIISRYSYFPFHKWETWGSQILMYMPKVTWLVLRSGSCGFTPMQRLSLLASQLAKGIQLVDCIFLEYMLFTNSILLMEVNMACLWGLFYQE